MNKKASLLAALLLAPAALWTSSTFASSGTDASDRPEPPSHSGSMARGERPQGFFGTGVTRSAANFEDGATVTVTSDDSDTVSKIWAFDWTKEWSRVEGATAGVAKISNGVTVTVTGPDADSVAKIQEMAARQPGAVRPDAAGFGSGSKRPEFGSGAQNAQSRRGARESAASDSTAQASAKSARHDAVAKQVKSRLSTSLAAVNKLPSEQRSAVYSKVIAKVDGLVSSATSSGDASSAEIYSILKEILQDSADAAQ